MRLKLEEDYL